MTKKRVFKITGNFQAGKPTKNKLIFTTQAMVQLVQKINDRAKSNKPVIGTILNTKEINLTESQITHEILSALFVDGRIELTILVRENIPGSVVKGLMNLVNFVPKPIVLQSKYIESKYRMIESFGDLIRIDLGIDDTNG